MGLMAERATWRVKTGLAEMLKGGVIMDVVTPEQARIAEEAGACAVMALERVPADIRRDGGVARMSDPAMIKGIQEAVSIPVMAKARIGHFAEAQRVVIVGVDQMAFFASYLRHTLSLLDIRAEIVASTGGESLQRLGRIDDETLVIVLSCGRAHPLLLRAMKLALHRRARTLAISDASMSEVGEHAEQTLYFSSNSPSFARSNTALLALVQALAHGLYARDEAVHKDRIRAYKLK